MDLPTKSSVTQEPHQLLAAEPQVQLFLQVHLFLQEPLLQQEQL